ncbi:uncharacterized protein BDZ99DRAFT_112314 [Mytilinidion resinicola]|uniref:CFEM domain-containing protein n=1 Tax=Mytilinidion resinicola TaxID=574789 RepID=A0A6A6YAN1_9PEZI|nr:uncharacterized protein BDZ99DRAFT_112314 [Mytilinidion resinicola]KAF2805064.1 hypothetical protein BDZ99DRAFT_112314 [Mytilinidion resinicola]
MTRLILLSTIFSLASFVVAEYPSCALSCLDDATEISATGCSATDGYCLCTNTPYLEETTCCIRSSCDSADQTTAFDQAVYNCATWGVTLNTHLSVTCSSATTTTASAASVATSSAVSYYSSKPNSYKYPKNKKGLSSGAKGGIGGGIALIVLIFTALSGFLIKRRNSKKAAITAAAAPPTATVPGAPAEYPGKEAATVTVNPVPSPAPQYSTQGGPYAPPMQPQGQYPQPIYAPQPQYPAPPQQQQYAQYGQPPPQQYPQPVYSPGPELQGSPIGQQPQQNFSGAELSGTLPQPKHEAP